MDGWKAYVMSIYAVLNLTILAVSAGIETGEECNRVFFVTRRPVLVLETARVAFHTWASQIVIVAKLAAVFSFFDTIQSRLRNLNRRIYAAISGVPRRLFVSLRLGLGLSLGLGPQGGVGGLGL